MISAQYEGLSLRDQASHFLRGAVDSEQEDMNRSIEKPSPQSKGLTAGHVVVAVIAAAAVKSLHFQCLDVPLQAYDSRPKKGRCILQIAS